MKYTWLYIAAGAAIFAVLIGVAVKYYKKQKDESGDTDIAPVDDTPPPDNQDTNQFTKKYIATLSYKTLVDEARELVSKLDISQSGSDCIVTMNVLPNKLANDFFNTNKETGAFDYLNLTKDEEDKMVIFSIIQDNKPLVTEVLIPAHINDDYYDVVPEDKIYVKKITLK